MRIANLFGAALLAALLPIAAPIHSEVIPNYTASWYNSDQDGMGIPCIHQGVTVFCSWFLYDANGKGSFLISSGKLQKNPSGKDFYTGPLYRAWGTPPQGFDKAKTTSAPVGTMSMVFNSTMSATYTYSFVNEGGGTQAGTLQLYPYQFGCAPPTVSNGTSLCVAPEGTKVIGSNRLPSGCTTWTEQCWSNSIADGTAKLMASSVTDETGRKVMFAIFRNNTTAFGVTGLWNVLPVYEDGSPIGDIGFGTSSEMDWYVASKNGVIAHVAQTNSCVERRTDPVTHVWGYVPVTCPNLN